MTSQAGQTSQERRTQVEIRGEDFWIDGEPTYRGRAWRDQRIEGLLFNARMVQATFDDLNPDTRHLWAYPDSGEWDPERNGREFVQMVPEPSPRTAGGDRQPPGRAPARLPRPPAVDQHRLHRLR
jgi:hypothetical protein